jgi:chitodextrinase
MKGQISATLVIMLVVAATSVHAQCPTPDFNLPSTACREQNLQLENLSGTGSFEWDYCSGDLLNTPTARSAYTLPGANGRPSFEYVKDGTKWYAFVTGTFTNRLYRITFDDPAQAPAFIENLGDLGGKLHGPGSVRIINDNGNWYGLLHNTDNGELLKLSFGNSLMNEITTTSLFTGIGSTNTGLVVTRDGSNGWVCVLSTPANNFQVIRLGANLSSPTASDILITGFVPNPNALFDLDLVRTCDQWFAFATNLGNGNLYRLSFGSSLFQQPTIDQIGDLGSIQGGRLRIVKDGEDYYLLVISVGGSFFKVGLGDDLSNLSMNVDDEGTFSGLLQNTIGVGTVYNNSTWIISVVDAATGNVSSVDYPNNCSVTEFNADSNKPGVRYSQDGDYNVTLKMTDGTGIVSTATKTITVSTSVSPDIAFSTEDVCVGYNVTFNATSLAGGISSYDWDFGDATAHSGAIQPTHIYTVANTYHPSLTITATNGCTNNAQANIKLYDEPQAAFTVPSGLVCTNNEYMFVNTTSDIYDGLLEYSWKLDGSEISTSRDLLYIFPVAPTS